MHLNKATQERVLAVLSDALEPVADTPTVVVTSTPNEDSNPYAKFFEQAKEAVCSRTHTPGSPEMTMALKGLTAYDAAQAQDIEQFWDRAKQDSELLTENTQRVEVAPPLEMTRENWAAALRGLFEHEKAGTLTRPILPENEPKTPRSHFEIFRHRMLPTPIIQTDLTPLEVTLAKDLHDAIPEGPIRVTTIEPTLPDPVTEGVLDQLRLERARKPVFPPVPRSDEDSARSARTLCFVQAYRRNYARAFSRIRN